MKFTIVCEKIDENYYIGKFEDGSSSFLKGLMSDGESEERVIEVLISLLFAKIKRKLMDSPGRDKRETLISPRSNHQPRMSNTESRQEYEFAF